jgi:hypothetical protein
VVSTLLVPAEARAETQDEKRADAPAVMRHE